MLNDNLLRLRKMKGLSREQLAELVNCAPETIARYERGKREPKPNLIKKIASALDVSVSYLMGESDNDKPNLRGAKEGALVTFDVVDKKVSCGREPNCNPDDLDFNVIGEQQVEDGKLAALCALYPAMKVIGIIAEGDSMEPEIYEGDIVLFEINPSNWSVGNQIVVCYEDSLFVKGIISGGNGHFPVVLRSFNRSYSDMVINKEQRFTILGRVLRIVASRSPKSII